MDQKSLVNPLTWFAYNLDLLILFILLNLIVDQDLESDEFLEQR